MFNTFTLHEKRESGWEAFCSKKEGCLTDVTRVLSSCFSLFLCRCASKNKVHRYWSILWPLYSRKHKELWFYKKDILWSYTSSLSSIPFVMHGMKKIESHFFHLRLYLPLSLQTSGIKSWLLRPKVGVKGSWWWWRRRRDSFKTSRTMFSCCREKGNEEESNAFKTHLTRDQNSQDKLPSGWESGEEERHFDLQSPHMFKSTFLQRNKKRVAMVMIFL